MILTKQMYVRRLYSCTNQLHISMYFQYVRCNDQSTSKLQLYCMQHFIISGESDQGNTTPSIQANDLFGMVLPSWLNDDDDGQLGGNKMPDSIWILDCWTAIIHCTERQFVIFSTVESFAIMRQPVASMDNRHHAHTVICATVNKQCYIYCSLPDTSFYPREGRSLL